MRGSTKYSVDCPCCNDKVSISELDLICPSCDFDGLFIDETFEGAKFVDWKEQDVEFFMFKTRKEYGSEVR